MGEALFFYLHARARNRFQKNGLELKIIMHAAPLPSSRKLPMSVAWTLKNLEWYIEVHNIAFKRVNVFRDP